MMRNAFVFVAVIALAGCASTPERGLTVTQSQPTTRPTTRPVLPFPVDTSALPDWAVKKHVTRDSAGNPQTAVTIESGVPVRVIVVPATRP